MNLELTLKILGAVLWLVLVACLQLDLESQSWIVLLLMFSPLFLIPLSRRLIESPTDARKLERSSMAAAILLGLSFCWMPAPSTATLALPWLVIRLLVAWQALKEFRSVWETPQFCILAARCFPAIGALWLVANRANWTPFGFDPLIVLLTGAHFHHAGFTLPLIAGLNAQKCPGCWTRFSCVAILIGVPVVAIGITCTHFGLLAFVEPFGVTLLVLGALGVALSQLRLATRPGLYFPHRILHAVSGLALICSMTLALGFGLRHLWPWAALTMPQMWTLHGSLNVFGFGLCGLLGWRLMEHQRE
ncbi:MAG: YndJ family transporter [Verrucomicrobia bacterium]|nr:YndJ family transporter [Verrucomicrobiota bacterium]